MSQETADFVVVGAGIVGLAVAAELRRRYAEARIVVLEKEGAPGVHASGRNSGVLHSGVYYPAGTLKARICSTGAREMFDFCVQHGVPAARIGKLIIPTRASDDAALDLLAGQARQNGAAVDVITSGELSELEPHARSSTGRALYLPDVAVVDPRAAVNALAEKLRSEGVKIAFDSPVIGAAGRCVETPRGRISFGSLVNAAGLHADAIARHFGVGAHYAVLPFRGTYYELRDGAAVRVRHLLYPVPDLRVPFLGVHFTPSAHGRVYIGPSALPALGREHYGGLRGVTAREVPAIAARVARQYARNEQGFRRLAHSEALRLWKPGFLGAARALVPGLAAADVVRSSKVGLRAQLIDRRSGRLEMDFVVEAGEASIHVLNAVSPGFTSAFPFARMVTDRLESDLNHG